MDAAPNLQAPDPGAVGLPPFDHYVPGRGQGLQLARSLRI